MAPRQHISFTAFIKRHPVLTYYALTFAISWGGVLLVIVVGGSGILATREQFERLLPFMIPALLGGPSIASLLLTGLVSGRAGFRDLWSRLLRWRVAAGWYAVALLAAPLVMLAVPFALSLASPVFVPTLFTTSDKASILLFGIVWGLIVGFCEELGWTGFANPRLRLRFGVLSTGLIMGVLWGAFHLPTNAVWGGAHVSGGLPLALFLTVYSLSFLVGQLPAYRVLMVWVYDRSESLLVAVLMHASLTACSLILGSSVTGGAFLTSLFVVAAAQWLVTAAVIVATRGKRSQPEPTSAIPAVHEVKRVAVPS